MPPVSIDHFPPAFSFEKMQDGSGSSFNCCQDDDRLALAKRIYLLSRMPWSEIRQASRKGLGAARKQDGFDVTMFVTSAYIKRNLPDKLPAVTLTTLIDSCFRGKRLKRPEPRKIVLVKRK
jgi:hypothetical protein